MHGVNGRAIDRIELLDWLVPQCEPDQVALLYPKGKKGLSPGWVNDADSAKRAIAAVRAGTLAGGVFRSKTLGGRRYTIRQAERLGLVPHRNGRVSAFCIDLDNHRGDGGNVAQFGSLCRLFGADPVTFSSKGGAGLHLFLQLAEPMAVESFVTWAQSWGFNKEGQPELFPKTAKRTQAWLPNEPNSQGGDTYRSGTFESCVVDGLHKPPGVRLPPEALMFLRGCVQQPGRNDALNAAAYSLGRRGVDRDEAWRLCELGATVCGLTADDPEQTQTTFDSGYTAGAAKADKKRRQPSSRTGIPTIRVVPETDPVGNLMDKITERLVAAGNCYLRADQCVTVNASMIQAILSPQHLAGVLNEHAEFYFTDGNRGQFRPLPPSYGSTWLNHPGQRRRIPEIRLFTRNPVFTDGWRLVQPGYDATAKTYYAGPTIGAVEGTECLDRLLVDFCFKSPADRANYIGMLLTVVLIPHFIGSKPAALLNGNQPELGKTILAQIIAILRDGAPVETATYNPNDEEFEKRLGAIVRRGATTIIVDNAKGRGRSMRIESPCLERSITDQILSFRLLGFSQDIRAENSHIFCLTANTPDVSRDIVTRSNVINLYYQGNPTRRKFLITDPEQYAIEHRDQLLGELIGMVERWKAEGMPRAATASRFNKKGWGNIVGGILDVCGEPDFLANAEQSAAQLDVSRRQFVELLDLLADKPKLTWCAKELAQLATSQSLLRDELGEEGDRSQATRMGILAGRYVDDRFQLPDGREVTFIQSAGRKGVVYGLKLD